MKDYWLNTDSRAYIDETYSQRILITNPEALKGVSADELWSKLTSTLGKYEFEMWLAETLVAICMQAVSEGKPMASISEIANTTLMTKWSVKDDWRIFMYPNRFKAVLINLPIFRTVKNEKYEVLLEIDLK